MINKHIENNALSTIEIPHNVFTKLEKRQKEAEGEKND